jgi:hypothetical protein
MVGLGNVGSVVGLGKEVGLGNVWVGLGSKVWRLHLSKLAGCSGLHFAASGGCITALRLTISSGVKVNAPDTNGWRVRIDDAKRSSTDKQGAIPKTDVLYPKRVAHPLPINRLALTFIIFPCPADDATLLNSLNLFALAPTALFRAIARPANKSDGNEAY